MGFSRTCGLLLWSLLGLRGAWAQEHADTTRMLPPVVIEGRQTPSTLIAGQRLWRLEASGIDAGSISTVAEVLEARTGLWVRRYGSGGMATASLRGTSATQTLLLVDGHRVADPQSGVLDLTLLPTVLLEAVDVVHGPAAALYGSGAMGGVVHLYTLRPTVQLGARATARLGAYGERSIGAVLHGGKGRIAAVAAAERSLATGDYPYPNPLPPPETRRREGADRQMTTIFGKVHYENVWRFEGTLWTTEVHRSLPGPGNAPPIDAWQTDRAHRLLLRAWRALPKGRFTFGGHYQHTKLHYVNTYARQKDTTKTYMLALRGVLEQAVDDRWAIALSAEGRWERAALRGGVEGYAGALAWQGSGQLGRFWLYPALRVDGYATEGRLFQALSPQLGLNLALMTNRLHLKGQIGRMFRAPTLGERFYVPGGNPNLRPERGWALESGLLMSLSGFTVELSTFYTALADQIVWYPALVAPGLQLWQPINVGQVRTRGLEASLATEQIPLGPMKLQGGSFYTYTRAEDRSDPRSRAYGHQLRYVPLHQFKTFLEVQWAALRIGLQGRYTGRRYLTTDETQALKPYAIFDGYLSWEQIRRYVRLALGLSVENLADHPYEVIRFYPMPPRHLRVQLRIDLNPENL
jgi:vitamin B12 transporter